MALVKFTKGCGNGGAKELHILTIEDFSSNDWVKEILQDQVWVKPVEPIPDWDWRAETKGHARETTK